MEVQREPSRASVEDPKQLPKIRIGTRWRICWDNCLIRGSTKAFGMEELLSNMHVNTKPVCCLSCVALLLCKPAAMEHDATNDMRGCMLPQYLMA